MPNIEHFRWIYLLYWHCTDILTEKEREAYFKSELEAIEKRINDELAKSNDYRRSPLQLLRHSERLMALSYQQIILRDCIEENKPLHVSLSDDKMREMVKRKEMLKRCEYNRLSEAEYRFQNIH